MAECGCMGHPTCFVCEADVGCPTDDERIHYYCSRRCEEFGEALLDRERVRAELAACLDEAGVVDVTTGRRVCTCCWGEKPHE